MQEAIQLTWSAMNARLRNLRLGAIVSLASLLALLLAAGIFRTWWALAGLPALVAIGTVFVYREYRILFAWENRVLALWGDSDLSMGILIQTMANHPHALKQSLRSLVASLPENPDFITPPMRQIHAHRRLFWTRSLLQHTRFARAAAFNLILACLPLSLWYTSRSGWPWVLIGLSPICALPVTESLVANFGFRRWKRRVAGLGEWDSAALPDFDARWDALDWSRAPKGWKASLMAQASRRRHR